ncbi:MAG: magnesium transporter [Planctomycetota bacterium]|nr:magnesium transporter [Planctomycetota bacterium]
MRPDRTSSLERASALRETLVVMFGVGDPDPASLQGALEKVAPEDVAAVLGDFPVDEKIRIFRALPSKEDQSVVVEETDRQSHREILEALTEEERRGIIGEMPVDDLVDHLEELPQDEQERIIATLDREDAEDVEELLQYPPDTAGGMMTTEFITVPAGVTSREALARIQGNVGAEFYAYVYVIDANERLEGVASIREILQADPGILVDTFMEKDVVSVPVDTDREEVAAAVERYNLTAIPVLDRASQIRGIVTVDDVMEAVQEEHSEDMLRMAGTTAVHPLYEPVKFDVAKRLPFLLITLTGGFAVLVLQNTFRDLITITLFAAVLPLLHMLSALSGNVAVVASTVLVRGLATGDVGSTRLKKALRRELLVAALIPLILAPLAGVALYFFGQATGRDEYCQPRIILAMALGMTASVIWAGLIGALVPIFCQLSRVIDPAIASGPFVTVTCDISSSLIFLVIVVLLV